MGFIFFLTLLEVPSGTEENVLADAEGPEGPPGSFQTYRAVLGETRHTDSILQEPQQPTSAPALLTAGTLLYVI